MKVSVEHMKNKRKEENETENISIQSQGNSAQKGLIKSLVKPLAQSRRSPVRSDQATQGFFQAHPESIQSWTEPAQPLCTISTAWLSSWGKMLLISRLNFSYLNLLPLLLILPIWTAVKSLAPSFQWSTNADNPIASQTDFLACLQLNQKPLWFPMTFQRLWRVALLTRFPILSAPLDAAQWLLWTSTHQVSSGNLWLNP